MKAVSRQEQCDALASAASALVGSARTHQPLLGDRRGVVMAEFLVALMPILIAALGFTQLAFIAIAKLAVRHSAALATRAAVVVIEEADGIPGAPVNIYSGFPAGGLEVAQPAASKGGTANVDKSQSQVAQLSDTAANSDSTKRTMEGLLGSLDRTSSRIKQIRTAAYWPLLAISPNVLDDGMQLASDLSKGELFPKMRVKGAIGGSDASRILGAFLYNLGAVAVTFPSGPGLKEVTDGLFPAGALITTRVTYLFRCQVPLVSPLICSSGWSLLFGDAWLDPVTMRAIAKTVGDPPQRAQDLPQWADEWKSTKAMRDRLQKRVDAFQGHKNDFDQVEWPFMLDTLLAWPGTRYFVLSAEAQLPLQSANYYPRAVPKDMEHMWELQKQKQDNSAQLPDVRETFKPLGDAVVNAANQVNQGVEAVSDEVKAIRNQASGYLTSLQNKAGGYIGALNNKAAGDIGQAKGTYDGYKNTLDRAAGSALGNVGQVFNNAGDVVSGAVKDVKQTGKSALGNISNTANGLANNLTQQTGGFADKLESDAGHYANNLTSDANRYANKLTSGAAGLSQDARNEAADAANTVRAAGQGYAQDVTNAGAQAADDVTSAGKGYAQDLVGYGQDLQNQGGSYVSNAYDQGSSYVGAQAKKAAGAAKKVASSAQNTAGKAVDGATQTAKGVLGGLSPDQF